MKAEEIIHGKLQGLPRGEPARIEAAGDGIKVCLRLDDWDRLGCLVKGIDLSFERDELPGPDPESIEQRISYLGERLRIIEVEKESERAILRSSPPRCDGEKISFYEMILSKGRGISFSRYDCSHPGQRRTSVAAALSLETLERLVADLIELMKEG